MIDLENIALVDRLRNHNDERLYREADVLMSEAADRITELYRQMAAKEQALQEIAMFGQLQTALERIAELEHQLSDSQKDAARYRWLTKHAYIGECSTEKGKVLDVQNCDREVPMREYEGYGQAKVDAAIDAAMQRDCDGAQHAKDSE